MTCRKKNNIRKILVIAEDDETVRPKTIEELFDGVRPFILNHICVIYILISHQNCILASKCIKCHT